MFGGSYLFVRRPCFSVGVGKNNNKKRPLRSSKMNVNSLLPGGLAHFTCGAFSLCALCACLSVFLSLLFSRDFLLHLPTVFLCFSSSSSSSLLLLLPPLSSSSARPPRATRTKTERLATLVLVLLMLRLHPDAGGCFSGR